VNRDQRARAEPRFGEAALRYALAGMGVFPIVPRGKKPLTDHGLKDATKDPTVIREWWQRRPGANVGIATGAESGVFVVDVDPRNDGNESLWELELKHGKLETTKVRTGGGGTHFYIKHPGGLVPCSAGRLGPGLDVKGDGGYVVAPPSIHCSGQPYRWERSDRAGGAPLAPAPTWLLDLIRNPAVGQSSPRPANEWVELIRGPIVRGARNDTLVRLAGHLLRIRVLDPAIAAELVQAVNEARCKPPLLPDEVQDIVESIASRELARIREFRP
jgi:hypothetical protein